MTSLADRDQREYIKQSLRAFRLAKKEGMILDEYNNIEDMSKIINFIFQGTHTGDNDLQKLAEKITKKYTDVFRFELKSYDTGEGMDNIPSNKVYFENKNEDQYENKTDDKKP